MDKIAQQTRNGSSSFARKMALVLIFLVPLTGAITISVHHFVEKAISHAVKVHAESNAMEWAERFNANLTNQDTALKNGTLSEDQRQVISAATFHGNAYAFIVYDLAGRTVYSSDYGIIETDHGPSISQDASAVATTGKPDMTVIQKINHLGDLNVFVDAIVPAKRPDGVVVGAIQLFLDESGTSTLYKSLLEWVGWVLPAVCAIAYAIPAGVFISMREKAFARQRHVKHLSMYDTLTGALNRHTLTTQCEDLFASRKPETRVGILFANVDKFKNINDLYGSEFGDAYLQNIAAHLKVCGGENAWVGRVGGDEFVVVCPDTTAKGLAALAALMVETSRKPFAFREMTLEGSLSIGTRLAAPKETVKAAFHAAALALYHAKANGRNQVQAYFPELDAAVLRRNSIEARLRQAVEKEDFEINYQQLNAPEDRSIKGFEALLRLKDDQGNPISPVEFIPIAEETGIIHELGLQTLRRAIQVAKTWPEHVFLSVNLSPIQFQSGDLDTKIAAVLSELDFPASRLELEVTESLLMDDEESVSSQLVGFKQQGISVAMDDFGTGYSGLGYLWKYDFDKLKIDRIFLQGVEIDGDRYRDIIETIVAIAKRMGMQVTIEGVESETQTAMLDQLPFDQYQGFLFGRPLTTEDALKLVSPQDDATARPSAA